MSRADPAAATPSEGGETLRVSVVYLRPGLTFERHLCLPAGATVGAAIAASRVLDEVPELARHPVQVGVFSRPRALDDALDDGDRVEIYRPLTIDPKEARRIRVEVKRRRKAAKNSVVPSGAASFTLLPDLAARALDLGAARGRIEDLLLAVGGDAGNPKAALQRP